MGQWYSPFPDNPRHREHRVTDARNMREHRQRKREQAEDRNAVWRSKHAPHADCPVPVVESDTPAAPSKRKRSRQKRRKQEATLAAMQNATGEWIQETGPGVDF